MTVSEMVCVRGGVIEGVSAPPVMTTSGSDSRLLLRGPQ